MKKALITATIGSFLGWFEVNDIHLLQNMGYEVHCACNMDLISTEERRKNLRESGAVLHHIPFNRNPISKDNVRCYKQLDDLFKRECFVLVHCHTPVAGVLTRFAVKKYRKFGTKVIYTAHGFHFFTGAPKKNWIIFFPIEWILSWITDVLITINKEDYKRAKQRLHAKKTVYIPGVGIDLKKITSIITNPKAKRVELGVDKNQKMLLSIGELTNRKNHESVIKAIKEMNDKSIQYFIAGKGELIGYLSNLVQKLQIEDQVHFLGYRNDISELLHATDVFVLPSHQEGLSVALMEAVACETLVACSRIRGNTDLITDERLLFDENDTKSVSETIDIVFNLNSYEIDMIKEANLKNLKKFELSKVSDLMKKEYGGK